MQSVHTLRIGDETYEYLVRKRKKQKKCTLSIRAGGTITLTVPLRVSFSWIERFMEHKSLWIRGVFQNHALQKTTPHIERKLAFQRYKVEAKESICKKLNAINTRYGYSFNRVTVRDTVSRWGSCSSKRNLSFSYKILFLPEHLQYYVLTHELCHLQEMNHSQRFWKLVEKTVPTYRKSRRELKNFSLL